MFWRLWKKVLPHFRQELSKYEARKLSTVMLGSRNMKKILFRAYGTAYYQLFALSAVSICHIIPKQHKRIKLGLPLFQFSLSLNVSACVRFYLINGQERTQTDSHVKGSIMLNFELYYFADHGCLFSVKYITHIGYSYAAIKKDCD